jgi:streptomycin 6-kinase
VADPGLTEADWLDRVPDLVRECAEIWELRLGEAYAAGAGGHTTRAELRDGTPVVLKVALPHREAEHEADALELYDSDGAVRLLARDDSRSAMLLERCEPGTPLSSLELEPALDVLVDLLPRLWKRAGAPFHTLVDEATWWLEYIPRERHQDVEPRLVDAAVDALSSLPSTQGELVLANQDLHGDNVLAAQRQPWLVIDPKPLLAEREFGVAAIVRSTELGQGRRAALRRLDRLSSELGLDRARVRGWTIGQTIAWSGCGDYIAEHVQVVRWLLEAR